MMQLRDFTGWQYYKHDFNDGNGPVLVGIKHLDESGLSHAISLKDPEVAAWLEAGGQPLPADEAPQ
jgi:hypothetical protein